MAESFKLTIDELRAIGPFRQAIGIYGFGLVIILGFHLFGSSPETEITLAFVAHCFYCWINPYIGFLQDKYLKYAGLSILLYFLMSLGFVYLVAKLNHFPIAEHSEFTSLYGASTVFYFVAITAIGLVRYIYRVLIEN